MDLSPPVISLVGAAEVTVQLFGEYFDAGATARDDLDGDMPVWKMITEVGSQGYRARGTGLARESPLGGLPTVLFCHPACLLSLPLRACLWTQRPCLT